MRNRRLAFEQAFRNHAAHAGEGQTLILARCRGGPSLRGGGGRFGGGSTGGGDDVFFHDATAGAGAGNAGQVDAFLLGDLFC